MKIIYHQLFYERNYKNIQISTAKTRQANFFFGSYLNQETLKERQNFLDIFFEFV